MLHCISYRLGILGLTWCLIFEFLSKEHPDDEEKCYFTPIHQVEVDYILSGKKPHNMFVFYLSRLLILEHTLPRGAKYVLHLQCGRCGRTTSLLIGVDICFYLGYRLISILCKDSHFFLLNFKAELRP